MPAVLGALLAVLAVTTAPAAVAGGTVRAAAARTGGGAGVGGAAVAGGTVAPCGPVAANSGSVSGLAAGATAIGWTANQMGVVACLGGSVYVTEPVGRTLGFSVYRGERASWADAGGFLPAPVTTFRRGPATVSITEFADRVVLGGAPYVVDYFRVAVHDGGGRAVTVDPGPSTGLVPLGRAPDRVAPGTTVDHDYAVAVDRFGLGSPWPTGSALVAAGGYRAHFAHMAAYWHAQLAAIAGVQVPVPGLDDAYRAGFIDTQIARSGNRLDTGVNGYASEFSHDVVGILANLFTQGYFAGAHALLLEARSVVGAQLQYDDGLWTYTWPWAIYLMKTGDLAFVRANFATGGAPGTGQPSLEAAAHAIAAARTGPGGIMEATDDIDTDGYWTVDDFEALMGLAAYRYLAQRVGDTAEATWAGAQYESLLASTDAVLDATVSRYHLAYLPCSMLQPNTANRCQNPEDANWAAPFLFGRWAWDAPLFGAPVSGPGVGLIDATYDYGFGRLRGKLPPGTLGGYPGGYYSTAYNAGYGSWGLASRHHRDQGIVGFEFMLATTQSGPFSWWESVTPPTATSPWTGRHPRSGQGSSPHAWGMANADMVLLDSVAAQRSDGALVVGRGIPDEWVDAGRTVAVTNFPTTGGARLDLQLSFRGLQVTCTVRGRPAGPLLLQLPAFQDNLARTTAGRLDPSSGTVTVPATTSRVTVTMRHRPAGD